MTNPLSRLHYSGSLLAVDKGTSRDECVIALHSIGVDACSFDALFSYLAADYPCLSYDLRGHGSAVALSHFDLDTLVDDAVKVVESCRCDKVHLLGHSIGGVIATLAAARLAESSSKKVQSLSIIASPPMGLAVFGERAQAIQHESRQTIVQTTMQRWFGGLEPSPELAQAMQYAEQQLRLVPVKTLLSSWQSLAQFSGYGDLAAHLPATLLLTGSQDLSTPASAMQIILDTLHKAGKTQTALHIIDGAGHMLPLTAPDTLIDLLLAHFKASGNTHFC
ncbi:alpha/beta fold hydrolase [Alcaligenes aquatilis]|jgi:pimeloyl-ACP methyl ester carboxylesterase|uniref:AB hydrolase-1 domain-containing protein n=2 Tax=Alcaligenes TaxID=507 RepID=A0AB33D0G7_ALCFA|nr:MULTISPECIES: alpha/beta hydrolase [Alcaligenes]ASR89818.1 hypothetical protein AFA_10370 [Alcaligenes faecalis]UQN34523.1 alpha/beta hydrolase [Alcaligenes aquatilis]UYY85704.1 alpha/beta hydrolase [Alcaligenes sp. SMD-FA]HBQ88327.1 hypothetical protein [Alcaligenes faecalis]